MRFGVSPCACGGEGHPTLNVRMSLMHSSLRAVSVCDFHCYRAKLLQASECGSAFGVHAQSDAAQYERHSNPRIYTH